LNKFDAYGKLVLQLYVTRAHTIAVLSIRAITSFYTTEILIN